MTNLKHELFRTQYIWRRGEESIDFFSEKGSRLSVELEYIKKKKIFDPRPPGRVTESFVRPYIGHVSRADHLGWKSSDTRLTPVRIHR